MKTLLIGSTAIAKGIKSCVRRSGTVQASIQHVALSCLAHTIEHADWTLSRDMIEGLTKAKGTKTAKLIAWFDAFMQATYDSKTQSFTYDEDMCNADISLEMATAVNWFDFKAPPKDTTKNMHDMISAFAKAGDKSVLTGKVDSETLSTMVESMMEIYNASIEETLQAVA